MGDLGGLTSQLISSSFGRAVKLGVPHLDAASTVGLNQLSVARNPDESTQNKLKTNKQTNKQTSLSFGRDVNLGVPYPDAACTVGLNQLSVARNPDKSTQTN